MCQHIEVALLVWISVCIVSTERTLLLAIRACLLACIKCLRIVGKLHLCRFIQLCGECISLRLATACVRAPTACVHPLAFAACCIDMDRHIDAVRCAILTAKLVHDDATLLQFLALLAWHFVAFHIDKHLVACCLKLCFQLLNNLATILILAKLLVGTALAAYVHAVRSTQYDNFLFHFLVCFY